LNTYGSRRTGNRFTVSGAFSGKVDSGFPSENATTQEEAFSGKVDSGFPSENATKAKKLERVPNRKPR
jgi:hypothetical protein